METLAPSQTVTARDSKGTKFVSIVEAAYNKAKLSEEEAQRVNDTPGLAGLIGDFIARSRLNNEYADEEVASTYGYLSGYRTPKDVAWQSDRLRELFPGVGFHDENAAKMAVPKGAEGLFVVPTWQSFAKLYGVSTYGEAVEL